MAQIFFSYSHDDESYRDQLEKHLASLKHQGLIASWHDRSIPAGGELDAEIDAHINAAEIILLLVSASFLASRYCYSIEMARALQRHDEGTARVVPVIVRPCEWQSTPLGRLRAVPRDGKPITTWPNYDEAYLDVAREIRQLLASKPGTQDMSSLAPGRSVPAASAAGILGATPTASGAVMQPHSAAAVVRSSNLRLSKSFTDRDIDKFLHQAFEFMARFFDGSLQELQARNAGVEGEVRRVDANTFTAAVYRDGERVAQCAIHMGGGSYRQSAITYSSDIAARGNSYNEMVSVAHDDQAMYLENMGMGGFGGPQKLTETGAAELFWSMLIRPLQQSSRPRRF